MERDDALSEIIAAVASVNGALFVGNGYNARAAHSISDEPWIFYMLGSMGLCAPLAAGFSRSANRAVLAVEGDGNAVMGLSGLPAVIAAARAPFLHIVLDNGRYESTGGQRVLAGDNLLANAAAGAGYGSVQEIAEKDALRAALKSALQAKEIVFVWVRTEAARIPACPRVSYSPEEITARFMAAVPPIRLGG